MKIIAWTMSIIRGLGVLGACHIFTIAIHNGAISDGLMSAPEHDPQVALALVSILAAGLILLLGRSRGFRWLKNFLQGLGVLVGTRFSLSYIVEFFTGSKETEEMMLAAVLISVVMTVLSFKIPPVSAPDGITGLFQRIQESRRQEAMTDVERWQLEQESHNTAADNTAIDDAVQDNHSVASIDVNTLTNTAAMLIFSTGDARDIMLRKKMGISESTAARVMDQLETAGVVSTPGKGGVRDILMSQTEYESRRQFPTGIHPE